MPTGRFAPSPTGALHLGNLRTALVAWLFARADGSRFLLRFEDLDRATVRAEHYRSQADDLTALGLDWDGEAIRQSDRLPHYQRAIDRLVREGLAYRCYCTRREILEAARAPNGPVGHAPYPGTCREMTASQQARHERTGRPAALRLRAGAIVADPTGAITFGDRLRGPVTEIVDDVVLRRNDGTPAYNLVSVLDDVLTGVELVVRGDDLVSSTPRQILVATALGLVPPHYAHIPLVLSAGGERLAKRHGAVTLGDRRRQGETPGQVLGFLAASLGLAEPGDVLVAHDLIERFDPSRLPRSPLILHNLDPA